MPAHPHLVLASASPARAALLRGAGVDPIIRVAEVDEEALVAAHTTAHGPAAVAETVQLLARAKAEKVAREVFARADTADADTADADTATVDTARADTATADAAAGASADACANGHIAAVLGCDSLLELDGAALGKPHTADRARERWRRIRGRSGVLHTGHHLITAAGRTTGATSHTTVHFADVSDAEIEAYVATGEPLEVAGAFTIDGYGGAFITHIEGDHHGVIGLSLPLLRTLLAEVDLTWVELWRHSDPPPSA